MSSNSSDDSLGIHVQFNVSDFFPWYRTELITISTEFREIRAAAGGKFFSQCATTFLKKCSPRTFILRAHINTCSLKVRSLISLGLLFGVDLFGIHFLPFSPAFGYLRRKSKRLCGVVSPYGSSGQLSAKPGSSNHATIFSSSIIAA